MLLRSYTQFLMQSKGQIKQHANVTEPEIHFVASYYTHDY